MSRSPVAIDESRERTRLLFEAGVISAADVTAWADGKIAEDSNPSQELIFFSTAPASSIAGMLESHAFPEPATALETISGLYQRDLISVEQSWDVLLKAANRGVRKPLAFSDQRLWDVFVWYDTAEDFPELPQEAKELLHAILTAPPKASAV